MTESDSSHLEEEPQEERGPEGSRDTGSDEPGAGPVDRPADTSDEESDTGIKPDGSETAGPDLQSGGG